MFGGGNEASLGNGKVTEEQVLQEEVKMDSERSEQVMPPVRPHVKKVHGNRVEETPADSVKETLGYHVKETFEPSVKEVAVDANF